MSLLEELSQSELITLVKQLKEENAMMNRDNIAFEKANLTLAKQIFEANKILDEIEPDHVLYQYWTVMFKELREALR
jgi:hypothetical protein